MNTFIQALLGICPFVVGPVTIALGALLIRGLFYRQEDELWGESGLPNE